MLSHVYPFSHSIANCAGSTNPGILGFAIDKFSQVFPDYRQRVLGHEAAHFLVGYLLGVPITGYSLSIGKEHVDFVEARIQQRLFQSKLEAQDIDQLAVVAMAGVASEAMEFDEIMGQTADLMDLQRLLNRANDKLSNMQQQDATRWAGMLHPPPAYTYMPCTHTHALGRP